MCFHTDEPSPERTACIRTAADVQQGKGRSQSTAAPGGRAPARRPTRTCLRQSQRCCLKMQGQGARVSCTLFWEIEKLSLVEQIDSCVVMHSCMQRMTSCVKQATLFVRQCLCVQQQNTVVCLLQVQRLCVHDKHAEPPCGLTCLHQAP